MYMGVTLKQPWGEFVVAGLKRSENRSWKSKYRGVLLIHTSKHPDKEWHEQVSLEAKYAGKQHLRRATTGSRGRLDIVMRNGYLIGAVIMEDCLSEALTPWCDHGVWHHRYRSPYKFTTPIKMNGRQKMFVVKDEIIKQIAATDMEMLNRLQKKSEELGFGEAL